MKVWAKTDGSVSEGKYLVVRRDGTIPAWPHFVIAAADPSAQAALSAYARDAASRGLDAEYVDSVQELAGDFGRYSYRHQMQALEGKHKGADPDKGPHRIDNPAVIEMMRGNGDLTAYRPHQIEAQGSEPQGPDIELILRDTLTVGNGSTDGDRVQFVQGISEAAAHIRAALTRPDPSLDVALVDRSLLKKARLYLAEAVRAAGGMAGYDALDTALAKAITNEIALSPPSLGMEGVREALIDARRQLEQYERDLTGEAYNDIEINAAIASISTPSVEVG